jgi:hypothetical protein
MSDFKWLELLKLENDYEAVRRKKGTGVVAIIEF